MSSQNVSSGRATLAEIARDASVSMSTVSKVLNGRSGVSDGVRERIEGLLHTAGYSRRGTVVDQERLIELVFASIDSEWSLQIIRGVESVARENGLNVILTESGGRPTGEPGWIDGILRRQPVGVVLLFSNLPLEYKRQLAIRNIPYVILDPAGEPDADVSSVGSSNWLGGLTATRHLIELGHRRIAMVTGPREMMCSRARLSGYHSALDEAGIPFDPTLVDAGQFDYEDGVAAGTNFLTLPERPTAIFAGNDMQAFGIYEAARLLRLAVPDDISVVGYDDVPSSGWMSPKLTTIHQPLIEMAEEATRLVMALRNDPDRRLTRIELATSLVVRASTAPPRRERYENEQYVSGKIEKTCANFMD
ncbi:LacI family transcriptional regulator [Subtercola vilae]|uniref:LacI family transcriptional regulator n=2 Tax=Subtercola vilae TaxID=2056433 RepID=A0A4V4REG6_9MICO|nr:LacI family DNA-binding transcriptional regulator [Subtercola vilae]TIH33874.1 LacI family transcriptional regulator [Subtercola vilae]